MITAARIIGLSESEQDIVTKLCTELRAKAPRNRIRSLYLDGKRAVQAASPMLPPYLQRCGAVLGWPAKAVESLARRTRLVGFNIPGADIGEYGISRILQENSYLTQAPLVELSAFTHGVAFQVVTKGAAGEPDALITSRTALDGTGEWDSRARRLTSFISVSDWGGPGRLPPDFVLYLPSETITVVNYVVVDRSSHSLGHVPVYPVTYKPRLERPFGQSRISRPVMFLTDAAVRAMLRMEGTADFYGSPHLLLLGATLDQFINCDDGAATWSWLMNQVNGLPDANPREVGEGNARVGIEQVSQGSQQPHMDSVDTIAAAFAGETNIPISSLGVGVRQANPTSAESYLASREDLIAEAEGAGDTFGAAHAAAFRDAWLIASGEKVLPDELLNLRASYRDPRQTSRAAAATATLTLIGAFPWMAESDAILETVGLDPLIVERLKAERAELMSRATGAQLLAEALTRQAAGRGEDT